MQLCTHTSVVPVAAQVRPKLHQEPVSSTLPMVVQGGPQIIEATRENHCQGPLSESVRNYQQAGPCTKDAIEFRLIACYVERKEQYTSRSSKKRSINAVREHFPILQVF